jgi:hypothetical protein
MAEQPDKPIMETLLSTTPMMLWHQAAGVVRGHLSSPAVVPSFAMELQCGIAVIPSVGKSPSKSITGDERWWWLKIFWASGRKCINVLIISSNIIWPGMPVWCISDAMPALAWWCRKGIDVLDVLRCCCCFIRAHPQKNSNLWVQHVMWTAHRICRRGPRFLLITPVNS